MSEIAEIQYEIPHYPGYLVTEGGKILKARKSGGYKEVKPYHNNESATLYVKIKDADGAFHSFRVNEVVVAARMQLVPGSDDSKKAVKQHEFDQTLVGRVVASGNSLVDTEQEILRIHADLVRQVKANGLPVDIDSPLINVAARMFFRLLKAWTDCLEEDLTVQRKDKNGQEYEEENPKIKMYLLLHDRTITALRAIGLTLERAVKQLPEASMPPTGGAVQNMFGQKEREEAVKSIVWNEE